MSKADDLLAVFKENVGEWTCGYCNSGSNQPAAIFREIKKMGYVFKEHSAGRWGKEMYCDNCGAMRSHYKLLNPEPQHKEKPRISISPKRRKEILQLFGNKDAFTGASITSVAEIDHKIPWTRLDEDIDANQLTDREVFRHFQLLTREHNLLKDRKCISCGQTGKRPPFLEVEFWYSGTYKYDGTCEGCGWFDGKRWREELNNNLK